MNSARSPRPPAPAAPLAVGLPTDDGVFVAWFSPRGLCRLEFPHRNLERSGPRPDQAHWPEGAKRWWRLTRDALERALRGQSFAALPPLDLAAGTDFQRRVWSALRAIPVGETRTYAGLARQLGRPRAARAVGQACGANPIPVLIPCHRVVAADGRGGGFSAGLDWKRRLLEREGVGWGITSR